MPHYLRKYFIEKKCNVYLIFVVNSKIEMFESYSDLLTFPRFKQYVSLIS